MVLFTTIITFKIKPIRIISPDEEETPIAFPERGHNMPDVYSHTSLSNNVSQVERTIENCQDVVKTREFEDEKTESKKTETKSKASKKKRKKSKHRKLRNTDRNGEDSRLNGDQFIHVNQAVEENDLNYTTHASLTNSTNEVNEQSIEMLNVKNNDDTK